MSTNGSNDEEFDSGSIAIVGIAGRFPGADNIDELWQLLCAGAEGSKRFDLTEIDASESAEATGDPNYVPRRGTISHVEDFDAPFFGLRPLEAKVMDPQQRIFLEICTSALESAGCVPDRLNGSIGVFATASQNTYRERCLRPNPEVCQSAGEVAVRIGNDLDYLASSVAYRLNLSGPAVTLRTACSSSLVAIANGCRALLDYECDAAIAGGVSVSVPQNAGYLHQPGSILSPDGHCRTFDEHARGTYFSNGGAVVVLKRLEDALSDGDEIWATIIGSAVNNDGANRASFTAPNVMGQSEVITMAQEMAGVDPATISYIEAHGTATEVGDPIEVEALSKAFRRKTDARQFCGIGSIKSNLGHLDVAAGVAGLVKVAMSLKYGYLPPTVNFDAPNPQIDFDNSPFRVLAEGCAWPRTDQPRRAGVSAFGTGGTNAHIILQEAPQQQQEEDAKRLKLLMFSARSEAALDDMSTQLEQTFSRHPDINLCDVEYTLRERRRQYDHRRFAVCSDPADAADILQNRRSKNLGSRHSSATRDDIVMMFPGQGTQYPGMGQGLYESDDVYRSAADECLELLGPSLGAEFREVLFATHCDDPQVVKALTNTAFAQPAIFLLEYALASMWLDRGIKPKAFIGHSVGEFVAACLSGIFTLHDALNLVALRGKLMQAQPAGTMLSVRASVEDLGDALPKSVSIACVNGPSLVVLSGPDSDIKTCKDQLESRDLACRPLHTSHAFHSSMMQPIVEPMLEAVEQISLGVADVPIMSTVTADWLDPANASDPAYWANHALRTVRFADGIRRLLDESYGVYLECGSRTTLSTLVRQQFSDKQTHVAIASLGEDMQPEAERIAALRAIGDLWAAGINVNTVVDSREDANRRVVQLPTYAFQRERLWVDAKPPESGGPPLVPRTGDLTSATPEILGEPTMSAPPQQSRDELLSDLILKVLGDTFGSDLSDTDKSVSFIEMGFDSLFLTQVSGKLAKETGVDITFREMLDDYPSPRELAQHLDSIMPDDVLQPAALSPQAQELPAASHAPIAIPNDPHGLPAGATTLDRLLEGQLDIMRRQLEFVSAANNVPVAVDSRSQKDSSDQSQSVPSQPAAKGSTERSDKSADTSTKPFGPMARVNTAGSDSLTEEQQKFILDLTDRYCQKTAKSRESTQANRARLADPRTVSGFHPLWKEMVYPLVTVSSSGSKLVDIDGNESIDVTNGFGTIMFGHSPDFLVDAIAEQLRSGYETGPQSILAGEAARLVSEMTGHERVAFANTGSEAVLAAMRMARTCTGRDKIVVFAGSYHGIFDEVVSRGSNIGGTRRTLPAAPGIPASALENILVLDYGSAESLDVIASQSSEIAAVMTEAVQGGNPSYLPVEFLQDLRRVTADNNIALIFDEVVTGFRTHPGGIQGIINIQADIATYGKVCGGGLPIGIVAGNSRYMDSLDGGYWQYGDQSRPEANMTFFAGTFMRHPLALAACNAVLKHLQAAGPELQSDLNEKMEVFAKRLNAVFEQASLPMRLNSF